LASNLGEIAALAEICQMVEDLILGLIFDTFGRKIPVIFGFTLMGAAILGIPFFR